MISCFSVVALHCDGYVHQYNHMETWWWLRALINVLFYNAVPLFFMLSGATLIGYHKKYDTRTFIRKRIKRTLIPFLAMSCFFSVLFLLTKMDEQGIGEIFSTIVVGFITRQCTFYDLLVFYTTLPTLCIYAFSVCND